MIGVQNPVAPALRRGAAVLGAVVEQLLPSFPDDLSETRPRGAERPRIAALGLPGFDHVDLAPIPFGHLDASGDRDPITHRQLLDRLRRWAVHAFDEQAVVAGHADAAPVPGAHLEATR